MAKLEKVPVPKMGSWKCGEDIIYTFCSHDEEDCNSNDYASGAGALWNHDAGRKHPQLTTAVVCPYDRKTKGALTMFAEEDCSGNSTRLFWKDNIEGGVYDHMHLFDAGYDNDTASAVVIPLGYSAVFYHHLAFGGAVENVFTLEGRSDVGGLGVCQPLEEKHIDRTSSVKVFAKAPAVGHWAVITTS